MKILYLYSEMVGYHMPVFELYVEKYKSEVHVVSWDKNKLKPYEPKQIQGVYYYKRSEYSTKQLLKLAADINPTIIYVSGWMDKPYLLVTHHFKKKGVKIVVGFDDTWKGTIRQRVGSVVFKMILKHCYSHAWVAGPLQFEYAKRFGFKNKEVIFDMLSGNTNLFNKGGIDYLAEKKLQYPKAFLYVGNFRSVKGTDILIEAFKLYRTQYQGDWKLICVGNGDYKYLLEGNDGVEIIDFKDQYSLLEISRFAGVFVLPSRQDQWGVVVHEFTAAGMPLILSRGVGALATLFIENYNGISYSNNSVTALADALNNMANKPINELVEMGKNSFLLSGRISPVTSAANFMSLVK